MSAQSAVNPHHDAPQAEVRVVNARRFTLVIEPGHEEIWFAMRDLRGAFSAEEVAVAIDGKATVVTRYLRHLVRNGLAEEAGLSTDRLVLFRVHRLGATPVVLDQKGDVSKDYGLRRELWIATRHHRNCVTAAVLLDSVGQHIDITRAQVQRWISRLVAADYLTEMYGTHAKPKSGETEYYLRPLRNTGPLPPRFCEASLIYDVNLARRGSKADAFFGVAQAREVKL